jgi:2,4-dienoyl-CoA reductase-like NADH-dependent reductase (Old Yellow Enzyme family)/thioredoxin reductase
MEFATLGTGLRVGSLTLKNRIIFPPISTNLAAVTGEVTDAFIYHYARRAQGGAALITLENVCIDYPAAMEGATQPRFDDASFVPALSRLTERIHAHGALAFVELTHPGLMGSHPPVVAPSDVPLRPDRLRPTVLTVGEIDTLATRFAQSAAIAQRAGFDGVEVEAAHGLLINQFLSPLTNKRTDDYGGSLENRARFAGLIRERIAELCGPSYTVTARLGVIDYLEGGVRPETDGLALARQLQEQGYAALHADVGFGDKEKRLEPMAYPQAWRADLARTLKAGGVRIPVIAVGVIREPEVAEQLLADGTADLVALGRTLIADPDWPRKALGGSAQTIRKCVGCSECIVSRHAAGTAIRCGVNAAVGRGEAYATIVPAPRPKRIVVVGGGPAGLEAARVAARRGHRVVLFEQEATIGGALRLGCVPPGKEKMRWLVDYYRAALDELGVEVRTSATATAASVMAEHPDQVVVATGSDPLVPPVEGIHGPRVLLYTDILGGRAPGAQRASAPGEGSPQGESAGPGRPLPTGEQIVVGGGGLVGCETALYLAANGNSVAIVEMLPEIAMGMEPITRSYLLRELAEHGVTVYTNARIERLSEDRVFAATENGPREIPFDRFVVAFGGQPRQFAPLRVPTVLVGDAVRIGRLVEAVRDGYAVGREL